MSALVPEKPISLIVGTKEEEDDQPKKQSKEDYKKAKELEEARKAGTEPAEVDEEGKDINPHIPNYIARVPWYYGADRPTLKHQRVLFDKKTTDVPLDILPAKGIIEGKTATRYRKGACENCGAITHQKKDCLERPRKVGAKFTGTQIAPDEHIPVNEELSFDSKRDRWIGYDVSLHKKVIDEYSKVEEAKRQLKAQKLQQELMNAETEEVAREIKSKLKKVEEGEGADVGDESDEEEKYAEHAAMPGTKFEIKERITVRNLRIREDTAKYLRNLDPNSAFYDPKTRSMRENPYETLGKGPEDVDYAGDNFVRASGDVVQHSRSQLFAWDMVEKGADVHLQAEPTKLEQLKKEYVEKQKDLKSGTKDSIIDRYGGREHLEAPPRQLLMAQSEHYVEYSRTGTIIKGQEKVAAKSRYEEDVYINNHSSVWGSYYKEGSWGYKCCHSVVKQSYCTGDAGRQAVSNCQELAIINTAPVADQDAEATQKREKKKKKKKQKNRSRKDKKKRKVKVSSSSSSSGSESSGGSEVEEGELDARKLKKALKVEAKRQREEVCVDERKRSYNSLTEVRAPTEEEMEAFRLKRLRNDDPMAQFIR